MPAAYTIMRNGLALGVATGLMLGALLAGPSAHGAGDGGTKSETAVSLTLRKGIILLEAQNAALGDVLAAIANEAKLDLRIKGDLDETVTWSIRYAPLDGAIPGTLLQKLLRRHSWVLTYRSGEDGTTMPVAEMYILSSNDLGTTEQLVQSTTRGFLRIDGDDQILALQQLIQQPDPDAVSDLAALATGSEGNPVRSMATIALGRLQIPEARAALVRAADDENDMVRRWAVKGLGQMWGENAIEQLTRALLDDPAPVVRRQAVTELTSIGSDEALAFLRLAADDLDNSVRRLAERNLDFLQKQREGGGS